jgi:hypothetical protein
MLVLHVSWSDIRIGILRVVRAGFKGRCQQCAGRVRAPATPHADAAT